MIYLFISLKLKCFFLEENYIFFFEGSIIFLEEGYISFSNSHQLDFGRLKIYFLEDQSSYLDDLGCV